MRTLPGDPDAMVAAANQLRSLADKTSFARAAAGSYDKVFAGHRWSGEAAGSARTKAAKYPPKLDKAGRNVAEAAVALTILAAKLREAQQRLKTLNADAAALQIQLRHLAEGAIDETPEQMQSRQRRSSELGDAVRRAKSGASDVIEDYERASREVAQKLRALSVDGGRQDKGIDLGRGVKRLLFGSSDIDPLRRLQGFFGAARDTATGLWGLTGQVTHDLEGWRKNWVGLAKGLAYGAEHPVEFGKMLIDYDTLKTDPERWHGAMAFNVLATFLTGGGGAAMRAGGTVKGAAAARNLGSPPRPAPARRAPAVDADDMVNIRVKPLPSPSPMDAAAKAMSETPVLHGLTQSLGATGGKPGKNDSFVYEYEDGSNALYKPVSGEDRGLRAGITGGTLAAREVGAYKVDQHLGFDLVPPTIIVNDPKMGLGSAQKWVNGLGPTGSFSNYTKRQLDEMAVLDYIIANTDRHGANHASKPINGGKDYGLHAHDHGYSFPDNPENPILSPFVDFAKGKPLDPDVLAAVRNVDPAQLKADLLAAGVPPLAVNQAIARLKEIQSRGMITGETWGGKIVPKGVSAPKAVN